MKKTTIPLLMALTLSLNVQSENVLQDVFMTQYGERLEKNVFILSPNIEDQRFCDIMIDDARTVGGTWSTVNCARFLAGASHDRSVVSNVATYLEQLGDGKITEKEFHMYVRTIMVMRMKAQEVYTKKLGPLSSKQ